MVNGPFWDEGARFLENEKREWIEMTGHLRLFEGFLGSCGILENVRTLGS